MNAAQGARTAVRRAPVAPGLHASVLRLHREAGNRAVTGLLAVQRDVGWKKDGSTEGYKWNRDEHAVGKIRRIPLADVKGGLRDDAPIKSLSSEGAPGKAIVLVPDGLDATKSIEVVVFLHGHTEDSSTRPFAGWRALAKQPKVDKSKLGKDELADLELQERLRKGIDATDTAPVRDVALDQAEAQLEESGQPQLVMVLPQGGLNSEFGKFDAGKYVDDIVQRLLDEHVWKDGSKKEAKDKPKVGRLSMAGHSGAGGSVLSGMAGRSVAAAQAAEAAAKAGKKAPDTPSDVITGDLVLFDAINGPNELKSFQTWAEMRLDQDLAALKSRATDKDKLDYLKTAQKLRVVSHGDKYKTRADLLEGTVSTWFQKNGAALGGFAGGLRANYTFQVIPGEHEELLRGTRADKQRAAGKGGILEAIMALHTEVKTVADLPALPASDQPKAPAGPKK